MVIAGCSVCYAASSWGEGGTVSVSVLQLSVGVFASAFSTGLLTACGGETDLHKLLKRNAIVH